MESTKIEYLNKRRQSVNFTTNSSILKKLSEFEDLLWFETKIKENIYYPNIHVFYDYELYGYTEPIAYTSINF